VGSRKVSDKGAERARTLARRLAERGVVVVSGLAYGVDINAHTAAIESGGKTIAVIGTPVDKAYPAAHADVQEQIYRDHLLVSPFPIGSEVFPSNFPERNKVMAALSDGTCIVEAGDTSGSLHQARECIRLGRWLFIMRNNLENGSNSWAQRFVAPENMADADKVRVIDSIDDIIGVL
jgi:DNA processing protein